MTFWLFVVQTFWLFVVQNFFVIAPHLTLLASQRDSEGDIDTMALLTHGLVQCFVFLLRHPVRASLFLFQLTLLPPLSNSSSLLLLGPGLQLIVMPLGSSLMGCHGWVMRQQQLTWPGAVFSIAVDSETSSMWLNSHNCIAMA